MPPVKSKVGTALQVGARISWSCHPGFIPCRHCAGKGPFFKSLAKRCGHRGFQCRYVHAAGGPGTSCIDAGNGRSHIYFDLEFIPIQALDLEVGVTCMLP